MGQFKPIPPEPGRRWPPAHCYMDEDGRWWEAPGKPLTLECSSYVTVIGANIKNECHQGIYIAPAEKPADKEG